jgi:hypothetical protein
MFRKGGFSVKSPRKALILFVAFLSLYAIWPIKDLYAAQLTQFFISGEKSSYLIAGKEYSIFFDSDKAATTAVNTHLEYSVGNGGIWNYLSSLPTDSKRCYNGCFWVPIDPQLTTAKFRLGADFIPLIGGRTYSEKTVGPYKILQPADPTDLTATSNDDGTVTLKWNDNSNMESYYQITRSGPDGTKKFNVNDTMDHVGPLNYVDKQTNQEKTTFYVYSLSVVIDKYDLPEDLQPGTLNVFAKTKVPIRPADKFKDIPIIIPSDKTGIDPNAKFLEKYNLNIVDFDKVASSRLNLNKNSLELKTGESETLTATITPSNAANQKVTWSSNNIQVAEVDSNGKVTAKSPGVAKISVQTENKVLVDTCTVNVHPKSDLPAPDTVTVTFKDIVGHKANAEITNAVALGIVSGYPDGTFRPDANVTRAEFATMLMKALKPTVTVAGQTLSFADLENIGIWAIQYVAQAVQLEIINGYDDFTFRPNANITHAEMIAMVIRASGLKTGNVQQTGFTDDVDIPNWAKPAVSKAEETGIIIVGGLPDNKFVPQMQSTRSEAVSAIVRMLKIKK